MLDRDYVKEVLISHSQIVDYCEELAKTIENEYQDKEINLLCVLKGSIPFLVELCKHFTRDDINYEFIRASSYEGETTETSGKVSITGATFATAKNKDFIIIEDIIDTGYTLSVLHQHLLDEGANSLKIATLLDKPDRRIVEMVSDYVGFSIPNHFVIGFGLDYNEKYRNLEDIVIPYPEKL